MCDEELDARSDQYSLGLILQELATLTPALEGANVPDLLARAAEGRRRPVEHVSGDRIPRELTAVIDRAASVDPGNRYPSVRALADDLRRFLRGEAVEALRDSAWQKVLRFVAQHRQEAGVAVLAFDRIHPYDWTLVAAMPAARLFERRGDSR